MPLDGKVKLPLMGEVSKKTAVIGGVVFAGFIGFMYIRAKNNNAAATAAAGTAAATAGTSNLVTDPAGNTCSALGESGYCPGSEQDIAYQNEQSGYYGSAGGLYGDSTDQYGGLVSNSPFVQGGTCTAADGSQGVYDSLGNCIPTGGTATTPTTPTTTPTTADQWVIQTAALMPNAAIFETAAAKIFAGLTVTTAQKDLFLEGVGLNPLPPGITYPPINTSDTSGQPGGGNAGSPSGSGGGTPTSGNNVTIPVTFGESANTALAKIRAAGFSATTNPLRNPIHQYTSQGSSPEGGTSAPKGSRVVVNVKQVA